MNKPILPINLHARALLSSGNIICNIDKNYYLSIVVQTEMWIGILEVDRGIPIRVSKH